MKLLCRIQTTNVVSFSSKNVSQTYLNVMQWLYHKHSKSVKCIERRKAEKRQKCAGDAIETGLIEKVRVVLWTDSDTQHLWPKDTRQYTGSYPLKFCFFPQTHSFLFALFPQKLIYKEKVGILLRPRKRGDGCKMRKTSYFCCPGVAIK
jgi:hypothetical protein